jgi:hypothetical protein
MSNNPYAQVALTYVRRPFSSWASGIISSVLLLFFIPVSFGLINKQNGYLFIFGMPLLGLLMLFAVVHAKEQFSSSRTRLMPKFWRVHAVVAAAVAVLCAVLVPTLWTLLAGWHSVGLVAVTLLLFGAILWLVLSSSGWFSWPLLIAMFGLLITESGRTCLEQVFVGHFEPQAWGLLLTGALITLLGGMRMFRINENMLDYRWREWDSSNGRGEATGPLFSDDPITKRMKDWLADRQMEILTRHAQRASGSRWSSVCRWRAGMFFGWSLLFWILGMMLYTHFLIWVVPSKDGFMPTDKLSFIVVFMPMVAMLNQLICRFPTVGYEVLRAVERGAYVRQLGAAAAWGLFQLWGGACIGVALWWWLLGPRPLPTGALADIATVSFAVLVLFSGVMAWMARYRSKWLTVLAVAAMWPAASVFSTIWFFGVSHNQEPPCNVLWIVVILAAVGLLITYDAYRRWLKADFD